MYEFVYVDYETIPEEEYFPDAKIFVENFNKKSTSGSVLKKGIQFSFIRSEYHELYMKIDVTEMKWKSDNSPNTKF